MCSTLTLKITVLSPGSTLVNCTLCPFMQNRLFIDCERIVNINGFLLTGPILVPYLAVLATPWWGQHEPQSLQHRKASLFFSAKLHWQPSVPPSNKPTSPAPLLPSLIFFPTDLWNNEDPHSILTLCFKHFAFLLYIKTIVLLSVPAEVCEIKTSVTDFHICSCSFVWKSSASLSGSPGSDTHSFYPRLRVIFLYALRCNPPYTIRTSRQTYRYSSRVCSVSPAVSQRAMPH